MNDKWTYRGHKCEIDEDRDEDNIKYYHLVDLPVPTRGPTSVGCISPYDDSHEAVELWIEAGYPHRDEVGLVGGSLGNEDWGMHLLRERAERLQRLSPIRNGILKRVCEGLEWFKISDVWLPDRTVIEIADNWNIQCWFNGKELGIRTSNDYLIFRAVNPNMINSIKDYFSTFTEIPESSTS